jgi:hypothetical protein
VLAEGGATDAELKHAPTGTAARHLVDNSAPPNPDRLQEVPHSPEVVVGTGK